MQTVMTGSFVQTPNFAIDTTAVDSNADRAQERFTSHRSLERRFGPSGSAARVPSDMSIWPPAALFDAVYASAVLDHFGFARISRRSGGTCSIWWAKNVIGPIPANEENCSWPIAARQQHYRSRDGRRGNRKCH